MPAGEHIDVLALFPVERAALIDVLRSLTEDDWGRPTVCAGWTVKDIAQHLLADDLGRLSHGRDQWRGFRRFAASSASGDFDLVGMINRQNELWVEATRRLSPNVIVELLRWSGDETHAYFKSLHPDAESLGVSWAGESRSPVWFDLAREYTERWHHQAQIRDSTQRSLLLEPCLLRPVFQTFAHAVPHNLRAIEAPDGTTIQLTITGEAGGRWWAIRHRGRWQLGDPTDEHPAAVVTLDEDSAWRMFTKGISPEQARQRARIEGDQRLCDQLLRSLAIVA